MNRYLIAYPGNCVTDTSGISGSSITNIYGNNHTVYYNKSAYPALGGQTYTLNGGGTLKPVNKII